MASAPFLLAMVGPSRRGPPKCAVARPVLRPRHGVVDEDDLAANCLRRAPPSNRRASRSRPAPPSMPSGGVEPLLPSAVITSGCGKGAVIHAFSSPRTQTGMSNGSTRTFAKPIAFSLRTAQSRARASASVPASRWPDLRRQAFDDVPCIIVLQRRIAKARDLGRNGLGEGGGGGREQQRGEQGFGHERLRRAGTLARSHPALR